MPSPTCSFTMRSPLGTVDSVNLIASVSHSGADRNEGVIWNEEDLARFDDMNDVWVCDFWGNPDVLEGFRSAGSILDCLELHIFPRPLIGVAEVILRLIR